MSTVDVPQFRQYRASGFPACLHAKYSTSLSMSDIYQAPAADLTHGRPDFTVSGVLAEAWAKTRGNKARVWMGFGLYLLVVIPIWAVLTYFLKEGMFAAGLRYIVTNSVNEALAAGIWMLGVKLACGIAAEPKEVYAYIEYYPRLLAAYLLISVLIAAGLFLLVLPGIYLAVAYQFAVVLIVDRKLGIWQALETSRKAVTRCWFRVFFLVLIYFAIFVVSLLPLGIGLIWTLPMGVILKGIVYREVFGYQSEGG